MDAETIERLAREAGMYFAKYGFGDVPEVECTLDSLLRFAALVRAEALEEAAKVAESMPDELNDEQCFRPPSCYRAAEAIRALK